MPVYDYEYEAEFEDLYGLTQFFDDLNANGLAALAAWGYPPLCVVETSPGNFKHGSNSPVFVPCVAFEKLSYSL
jgi:hypothetical protein